MPNENTSENHYGLAVSLSKEALKAMLLVNGGAATALIALTDKGNHNYSFSTLIFGGAAVLTVAAFIFGYLSQLSYANMRFQNEQAEKAKEKNDRVKKKIHDDGAIDEFCKHRIFQCIVAVLMFGNIAADLCAIKIAADIAGAPSATKIVQNFREDISLPSSGNFPRMGSRAPTDR